MSMSGHKDTSPPCSPRTPNDSPNADPEPSTANDMIPPTDSETAPAQNKRFPRFLVIEGLDPNKTLRRANGTILDKTIDGATSATTKKEWMGKSVLVEVNYEAYSTNLLKLTQIGGMPVRVSAHRSLNYAKGVVRFRQAAQDLTNEDLARDLNASRRNRNQPQVKDASRVTITKGGKKVQTGTFFPDLWCPNSTRAHLSWLWEIWRRTIHPPPQTLLQVSAIWPWSTHLPGYWGYLPPVFGHSQTGWLPEQGMPKLWRCTSCHQQGLPSIPHGEKSSRDPSGESLHTPCSPGASRADRFSRSGRELICPSIGQQPSRPAQPQSGTQRWERQIAGSDLYTSPG